MTATIVGNETKCGNNAPRRHAVKIHTYNRLVVTVVVVVILQLMVVVAIPVVFPLCVFCIANCKQAQKHRDTHTHAQTQHVRGSLQELWKRALSNLRITKLISNTTSTLAAPTCNHMCLSSSVAIAVFVSVCVCLCVCTAIGARGQLHLHYRPS